VIWIVGAALGSLGFLLSFLIRQEILSNVKTDTTYGLKEDSPVNGQEDRREKMKPPMAVNTESQITPWGLAKRRANSLSSLPFY
jgi:hypothetical protein